MDVSFRCRSCCWCWKNCWSCCNADSTFNGNVDDNAGWIIVVEVVFPKSFFKKC